MMAAEEVSATVAHLQGEHSLLARLHYGTGLRITEALLLRVKGLDFGHRSLNVRSVKGGKDRVVMLPPSLTVDLQAQLVWIADVDAGQAGGGMPYALEHKNPQVGQS